MSNYTVTTNFAEKDSLPSGNAAKVIKGSEFTTEFNNIATASATKADIASPAFTGTVTIPTATITTANTTTANITTANCDNLTVEKATNSGQTDLLIHNTGTGDADAVLKLDASATGESDIEFLHDGSLGAVISYFVDGGAPDLNINTNTSGSVIDLQPNSVNTLRAAEGVVTVTGDLRISDGSVKGEIGIVDTNDVYLADNIAGIRVSGSLTNNIFACDQNGAITNGVTNLGANTGRFKEGYFTDLKTNDLTVEKVGDAKITIKGTDSGGDDDDAELYLDSNGNGESAIRFQTDGTDGAALFWSPQSNDDLVIQTYSAASDGGIHLRVKEEDSLLVKEDGILQLSNGTVRGTVGIVSTDEVFIADTVCGLRMSGAGVINIFPVDGNGAGTNEIANLGTSNDRFKTIFSKNALDTSSDRNLKQSIEELSEAEVRVAQVCKGLIRKYKWKDSVERKGVDGSRYHVGVIAQDLEAAFAAEGLNAEEYGMFTRSEETGTLSVSYSELLAFIIGGL